MSKNFEEAYIELAQSEAPDLWDRIEAGLSEKKIVTVSAQPEKKKESIIVLFRRYQAVAAALLCVVIIVPAIILMRQVGMPGASQNESAQAPEMNGKGAAPAEAVPAEEAVAGAMAEEAVAEAAPAEEMPAAEAAPVAGAAEEMPVAEAAAGASFAQTESAEAETAMEDAASDGEASKEMIADMKEMDAEKESEAAPAENGRSEAVKEEGTADILYNVQVEIVDEKVFDGAGNQEDAGAVLTAIVLQADSGGELAIGDEVTIFIPIYSSLYLPVGESFELDLRKEQSEEYDYTMAAFIERLKMQ